MRSSNEIGSDGLYNFISAIRVASSDAALGKESWSSLMMKFIQRNVTKTHASNINTFQSPNHGPLGVLTKTECNFIIIHIDKLPLNQLIINLKVPLIKAYMEWKVTY